MKRKAANFYLLTIFSFLLFVGACASKTTEIGAVKAADAVTNAETADGEVAEILRFIEKMPDSAKGYNRLAAVYIKKARETGDFSLNAKAEAAVARALEVAPGDVSAKKLQASLHLTFHRFAEALEAGQKLQAEFSSDAFVYGVLTDANAELGNYAQAVEAAQKMVDLKPNTASYARVAHLRSLHGDSDGAIEAMKLAARTADPLDKEAQSWCLVQLGDELWKIGRYREAEKVYDEALQIFPQFYLALAGKGRARAAQNDFDAAIELLNDANNRVPNAETAILLGDIYTRRGEAEKAAQFYELVEVIERRIGESGDQKRLALLWADRGVRLDEALAITQREAAARKNIYTADALAWTLYKKGRFEEAKKEIFAALNLKTKDARILYHAGMIEKSLGNKREAKTLLEKALKLNPAFDLLQAQTARAALAEIS